MNKCCILDCLSKIMNKYKFILMPFISISIIYLFLLIPLTLFKNSKVITLENLYYASLIILTFLLVLVAYTQLNKIHSVSQSEFLLKVFNHLSDKTIIKALEILHIMRLQAAEECKSDINNTDKEINKKISIKIRELRTNEKLANDFIYLKNFLDYLEHISYLCQQGEISIEDIRKCLDERISTYHDFYEDLIKYYQDKNQKYKPYQSFASLAGKNHNNN